MPIGQPFLKGILIDDNQAILAEATAPLTVQRPHEGWSEQSPADWISAAESVLQQLTAHGLGKVRGIGLSGHMHGATLLDAADNVLRPCILWNDTRSHAEAARLDADPRFRALSGNIVFPGFTAPKLDWVRAHEPQIWAKVAKVLLPKDYLRLWLIGDHVAEMSDAAGTAWLDTGRRDWSDDLLAATGLTRAQMPRLVEGSDVSGVLRATLAQRWGQAILQALGRQPLYFSAALPLRTLSPLFNRYEGGEHYGFHVDGAIMRQQGLIPGGQRQPVARARLLRQSLQQQRLLR